VFPKTTLETGTDSSHRVGAAYGGLGETDKMFEYGIDGRLDRLRFIPTFPGPAADPPWESVCRGETLAQILGRIWWLGRAFFSALDQDLPLDEQRGLFLSASRPERLCSSPRGLLLDRTWL